MTRGLALAALAAVFVLGIAGAASADVPGDRLNVTVNGLAAPHPFVLVSDLVADIDVSPNHIATTFYRGGPVNPDSYDEEGTSAAEFARLAGVDPGTLVDDSAMNVTLNGGGYTNGGPVVELSKEQVLDGFANVLEASAAGQAVFRSELETGGEGGYQIAFIRPMLSPSDAGGVVMTYRDSSLSVAFKTAGKALSVSATAHPSSGVNVGDPVTFTASVDGGASGAGWSYTWDFGDNTPLKTVTTTQASHAYADAGRYRVTVTVHHGDDDAGVSAPLFVGVVDKVKTEPPSGPSGPNGPNGPGGSSRTPVPGSGSTGASGGGTGPQNAVSTGRRKSSQTHDAKGEDTGVKRDSSNSGKGHHGQGTRATGANGTGSSTHGGSGLGASRHAAGGRGSGGLSAAARRRARLGGSHGAGEHSASPRHGNRIEGVLLPNAGATVLASAAGPSERRAQVLREQQAARTGQGSSAGAAAWGGGILLLVALLCAGGALEQLPAQRRTVWIGSP